MPAHDVFISYPSADKPAADAVCHGLEARGVRCWMAPRDVIPGSDWQTSLLDAISDARVVVLLFTGNTNTSEHIKREVTAAFEGGSVVIPFRLENVAPQGALRYHLTGVHWLDAFSQPIDQHIEQLSSTIKRVLERPPAGSEAGPTIVEVPPVTSEPSSAAAVDIAKPPSRPEPTLAPSRPSILPEPPKSTTAPPPPRPSPMPLTSAATAPRPSGDKKGGINPWLLIGGAVAALLIGVVAFASMNRTPSTPAPNDPAAQAEALRQQGVQIGVEPRPEPVPPTTTPVPTLDTPPEAPVQEPLVEPPVYDQPVDPGYVEEPAYDDQGNPK